MSGDKEELLGMIDTILTLLENREVIDWDAGEFLSNILDFLLDIAVKIMPPKKLVEWLSYTITYSLPIIETAVKGILLAQLKTLSDCNIDPRIPSYLRKSCYSPNNAGSNNYVNNKGLLIDISSIDYHNILSVSPLSESGRNYYFSNSDYYVVNDEKANGKLFSKKFNAINFCERNNISTSKVESKRKYDNVYQLARADDFNAFLWFVIHKAHFKQPEVIKGCLRDYTNTTVYYNESGEKYENENKLFPNNFNNLGEVKGECRLTTNYSIKPFKVGDTLVNLVDRSHEFTTNVISLCIKSTASDFNIENPSQLTDIDNVNNQPRTYNFSFVPVSSDYFSANWYVNRGTYFNYLKVKKEQRDYSKEFAICNLRYIPNANNIPGDNSKQIYGKLLFSIMPAPLVIIGKKFFYRILFNENGVQDPKGKYSINILSTKAELVKDENGNVYAKQYKVAYANGGLDVDSGFILNLNLNTKEYYLFNEKLSKESSNYDEEFKFLVSSVLFECYPNLTVYEFNYDFVMGMQLFDANVITSKILMLSLNLGLSLASVNRTYKEERISQIVDNIIKTEKVVPNECYFSFDNSRYDALLRESELKRANLYPFVNNNNDKNSNVNSIDANKFYEQLNQIDDSATAEQNQKVIEQVLNDAAVSITNSNSVITEGDGLSAVFSDMIKMLMNSIVDVLISPKILLLFMVNRKIMGDDKDFVGFDDLFEAIMGALVLIIKEIVDFLLNRLLDFILNELKQLLLQFSGLLVLEQIEYYTRLINQLIKACTFKIQRRDLLDTELDSVYYADINQATDEPIVENNC